MLQGLPRLYPDAARGLTLGAAALAAPLLGALLGGLLAAALAGASWRSGAVAGLAANLAAVPGYLRVTGPLLAGGFLADGLFFTLLFYGHVTLSVAAGAAASLWANGGPAAVRHGPGQPSTLTGVLLIGGAIALLAAGLSVLGAVAAPWTYAVLLSAAAAGHVWPVIAAGRGWLRLAGLSLLVAALGSAAFTGMVLVSFSATPVR